MKKVLIISYYFPPDNAIGSLRIKGLANYLCDFGWEPIIVTKNNVGANNIEKKFNCNSIKIIKTPKDQYDLIEDIKKKLGINKKTTIIKKAEKYDNLQQRKNKIDKIINYIVRKVCTILYEIITYPDAKWRWKSDAIRAAMDLLEKEKVDAIISSSSPITCHIIAKNLSHNFKIPWIADLRDLWSQNPYYAHGKIRYYFDRRLEINVLSMADFLVTTTHQSKERLEQLHENKIFSIPNGYDPEILQKSATVSKKFTVTYTGSLYMGKRDPTNLFIALKELIIENKIDTEKIDLRFYGPMEDWLTQLILDYDFQNIVKCYGEISHEEILRVQRESQLLLLLSWDNIEEKIVCPGKIYEYLAAKRPILSIGSPVGGSVDKLLEETKVGINVSSVCDIKRSLFNYFEEFYVNGIINYKGNIEAIKKYSQIEMTKKFVEILNIIDSC